MRRYVTWSEYVDVEVDVKDLLEDFTDEDLAGLGLMRIPAGVVPPVQDSTGVGSYEPAPSIVEHKMLCSWAHATKAVDQ
jgi:hypothetical protein